MVAQVLLLLLLDRLLTTEVAVSAGGPLELRSGQRLSELDEPLFALGLGDPGEHTDFGIRDLAAGKGLPDPRQLPEAGADPFMLPGLPRRE